MAVGLGSIWVVGTTGTGPPDCCTVVVQRIDPLSDRVVDVIGAGRGGGGDVWVDASGIWVEYLALEGDAVWVAHLDPETHELAARFKVPGEWSQTIFAAGSSIWVTALTTGTDGAFGGEGSTAQLDRIDPTSYLTETTNCADCGSWSFTQPGMAWVEVPGGVQRFDPESGEPFGEPVRLSADCCGPILSDGSGGVWTFDLNGRGTGRAAWHIDADGAIVGFVDLSRRADAIDWGGQAYAFDPTTNAIWVVHYRDSVSRIELSHG
jgi:hypothetical protein